MNIAILDLTHLDAMTREEVEGLWQRKLPKVPRPALQLRPLRRALAYELQVKQTGDVDRQTARALASALQQKIRAKITCPAKDEEDAVLQHEASIIPSRSLLSPGSVLVREWNGRRYQVAVKLDGFEMDGRSYKSLSQIAKTITGTHWSGPRFFGLVKAPTPKTSREVTTTRRAKTTTLEDGGVTTC